MTQQCLSTNKGAIWSPKGYLSVRRVHIFTATPSVSYSPFEPRPSVSLFLVF